MWAAENLDVDAECPPTEYPNSWEDVAEVLRFEDGCLTTSFVPLAGRDIAAVRASLFATDPTVLAVDRPARPTLIG